ncbi:anti-sigma factor family protein [Modestobacter roseus]|uniref:anti-sigma factor family protein n=1 Tax=Modestobacter roseus TaxID=1181884 RepID=UPI001FB59DDF|nr:zf-HC2 domain-containing protein [Modestobacter roseus]
MYALGAGTADERAVVRAHLEGCAACRAELAELTPVAARLADVDPDRLDEPPHRRPGWPTPSSPASPRRAPRPGAGRRPVHPGPGSLPVPSCWPPPRRRSRSAGWSARRLPRHRWRAWPCR